jgi:hypothetical protein
MNKIFKIILATLGGIEAVFSIVLPILVSLLWIKYSSMTGISSYVLLGAGLISSLFRAIKIGWFK